MKLIRDKIPEIIKKSGRNPITHIANDKEYLDELKMKLREEVDEFLKDENIDELVDIAEVVYTLSKLKGISVNRFDKKRKLKAKNRGEFKKRIILDSV